MRVASYGRILLSVLCGAAVLIAFVVVVFALNDKNPIQPMIIGLCSALGVTGSVYTFLRFDNL